MRRGTTVYWSRVPAALGRTPVLPRVPCVVSVNRAPLPRPPAPVRLAPQLGAELARPCRRHDVLLGGVTGVSRSFHLFLRVAVRNRSAPPGRQTNGSSVSRPEATDNRQQPSLREGPFHGHDVMRIADARCRGPSFGSSYCALLLCRKARFPSSQSCPFPDIWQNSRKAMVSEHW